MNAALQQNAALKKRADESDGERRHLEHALLAGKEEKDFLYVPGVSFCWLLQLYIVYGGCWKFSDRV